MNRTVRDIVAKIDTIFARGARIKKGDVSYDHYSPAAISARQLWDVLSALRGPDYEYRSGDDKQATTCIIRAACFPKTYANGHNRICIPASINDDHSGGPGRRHQLDCEHFRSHAQKAFRVLGLDWESENSAATIATAAKPLKKKSKSRTQRDPSSKFRS